MNEKIYNIIMQMNVKNRIQIINEHSNSVNFNQMEERMIKKQDDENGYVKVEQRLNFIQNYWLCFNPECSLPSHRAFDREDSHARLSECQKWTITCKQLLKMMEDETMPSQKNDAIQFSFGRKSLQDNIRSLIFTYHVNWDSYFQKLRDELISKAQKQISAMLGAIRQKIEGLKSKQFLTDLVWLQDEIRRKHSSEADICSSMNEIVGKYLGQVNRKEIKIRSAKGKQCQLPSFSDCLQPFQQKLFSYREISLYEALRPQRHEEFRGFVLDRVSSFNKLEQIASMCGKKPTQFVLKQRKTIKLNCPLCSYCDKRQLSAEQFEHDLKRIKKQISFEMLSHCFETHHNLMFEKYEIKAEKNLPNPSFEEITFQKLLSELRNSCYQKLIIIDRESGISGLPSEQPGAYRFEILSKNNRMMAKTKYLVTPDRKCTEFMINYILLYICQVEKLVSPASTVVESNSKDANRLEALKQILFQPLVEPTKSIPSTKLGPKPEISQKPAVKEQKLYEGHHEFINIFEPMLNMNFLMPEAVKKQEEGLIKEYPK